MPFKLQRSNYNLRFFFFFFFLGGWGGVGGGKILCQGNRDHALILFEMY